ncbi:MAG: hypothetical protein NTU93_18095 [Arthrobacter sp.]|nr:hypothetical protein [Arthrobacter sp.]
MLPVRRPLAAAAPVKSKFGNILPDCVHWCIMEEQMAETGTMMPEGLKC